MKMAFIGVEFINDDGKALRAIALVHCTWLTSRKKEV